MRGDLNAFVIQQRQRHSESVRDYTEESAEWRAVRAMRAKVVPLSGNEQLAHEQMQAIQRYKITVRYQPDMKPQDRLYQPAEGRYFQVETLTTVESKGKWTEIRAREWQLQQI